jgi:hypothetical protein
LEPAQTDALETIGIWVSRSNQPLSHWEIFDYELNSKNKGVRADKVVAGLEGKFYDLNG